MAAPGSLPVVLISLSRTRSSNSFWLDLKTLQGFQLLGDQPCAPGRLVQRPGWSPPGGSGILSRTTALLPGRLCESVTPPVPSPGLPSQGRAWGLELTCAGEWTPLRGLWRMPPSSSAQRAAWGSVLCSHCGPDVPWSLIQCCLCLITRKSFRLPSPPIHSAWGGWAGELEWVGGSAAARPTAPSLQVP